MLVADTDGQVVGFVSIWQPEDFIHNLFVSPEWQNHGIGTAVECSRHAHRTTGPPQMLDP